MCRFVVQKFLGYFMILRLFVFTTFTVYFLFFYKTAEDPEVLWMVPIQLYILFSFAATVKMKNGVNCVSVQLSTSRFRLLTETLLDELQEIGLVYHRQWILCPLLLSSSDDFFHKTYHE